MTEIDRTRLGQLMDRERATFRERHPRSGELAEDAKGSLLFGVPMNWMTRWPGDYPIFVDRAEGASFWDVDGNVFVDFCLGDTGGMAGHAPKVSVDAIAEQAAKGITLMLPTEDAAWVGREMARRFGVPYWNFTLTATDANRFAIRWARQVTGRSKVVVHNWCYHGSVDESFATLDANGDVVAREGNVGKPVPLDETTRVVEINDLDGLERALAARRRRGLHVRAGADEHRHRAARPGISRGGPRPVHAVRHAPADRRDPHDQRRPRWVHEGVGTAARHRHDRQDTGRGHPECRLRDEPGTERSGVRPDRLEERRRRRCRRHPGRQRAVARGHARDAGRGHDRRRLRPDDRAG